MPTSCSAFGCRNNSSMKQFSFHRFPKDPKKREKWIRATHRKDFIPGVSCCICSAHFEPGDFYPVYASGYKKLREEAVPSLFNFPRRFLPVKERKKKKCPPKQKEHQELPIVGESDAQEKSQTAERKKKKCSPTPEKLEELPIVAESNVQELGKSPTEELPESKRKRSPTPVELQDPLTLVQPNVELQESPTLVEYPDRTIKPLPTLVKIPEKTRKRSPTPVELRESPSLVEYPEGTIKPLPTLVKLPVKTRKRSPTPVELQESPILPESLDLAEERSDDDLKLSEDDLELSEDIPQMVLEVNTLPLTSTLQLSPLERNLYSKLHRVSRRLVDSRKNLKNLKAQNTRLKRKLVPMKSIIAELKEKSQIINEYKHIFDSIRDISKQFCGKFEKQGVQSAQLKEFSLILSSFLPKSI